MDREQNWYFTFGVGHFPHNKSYVKIYGTCDKAREKMFKRFGPRWSMQYETLEQTKHEKYGLSELVIEEEKEDE